MFSKNYYYKFLFSPLTFSDIYKYDVKSYPSCSLRDKIWNDRNYRTNMMKILKRGVTLPLDIWSNITTPSNLKVGCLAFEL